MGFNSGFKGLKNTMLSDDAPDNTVESAYPSKWNESPVQRASLVNELGLMSSSNV